MNPNEMLVKEAKEAERRGEKWQPKTIGLCPSCEDEQGGNGGGGGRPPPPGKPPKVVELKPPPPRGGGGGGGKGEGQPPPPPPGEGKGKKDEKEEEEEKEKEDEAKKDEAKEGKKDEHEPIDQKDIEAAKKGTQNVRQEFEDAMRYSEDYTTLAFEPVTSAADPGSYKDTNFIVKMNTALKDWKVGWKEFLGKRGSRLSVPDYISTRGKEPFITTLKQSARGRKILVIADLSGSMSDKAEDYKKAIISSMEVLDGIGTKTALFGFGGQTGQVGSFFFKVKRFEDQKWQPIHASKTAALQASGGTPTAEAYQGLEQYVRKHRPDVTVTITDGSPDDAAGTEKMVNRFKRHTRMVAFGIGSDHASARIMEEMLKNFHYNNVFSVDKVHDIPPKLVKLMAPPTT
jgi:uncharacterized protein with von Willebrand factor type A (vWA) domain